MENDKAKNDFNEWTSPTFILEFSAKQKQVHHNPFHSQAAPYTNGYLPIAIEVSDQQGRDYNEEIEKYLSRDGNKWNMTYKQACNAWCSRFGTLQYVGEPS